MNHPRVFSKAWFEKHQSRLVRFANTRIGRKVLGIKDKNIVAIGRSWYSIPQSETEVKTNFYIKSVFAERLYRNLKPLWWSLHWWDMAVANNLKPSLNVGFDTLDAYPDYDPEINTVSGTVRRRGSSISETLSTIRSGSGTGFYDSDNGGYGAWLSSDSVTNRYDGLERSIYLFDTSSIRSENSISSADFTFTAYSRSTTLGISNVNIVSSNPASNTSLSASDYDISDFGSTVFASISIAFLLLGNDETLSLNASGRANINKAGISKFGMRSSYDVNNSAPWSSETNSGITVYFGSAILPLQYHPTLTVVHTATKDGSANGSIEFGGDALRQMVVGREVTGSVQFSGGATASLEDSQKVENTYEFKVYDSDGNFITTWNDYLTEPQFKQKINSSGSVMTVRLGRSAERLIPNRVNWSDETGDGIITDAGDQYVFIDNVLKTIGEGTDVDVNYRVDMYQYYGEIDQLVTEGGEPYIFDDGESWAVADGSPNGRIKFTGYIQSYTSTYGAQQGVAVTIINQGADLANAVLTDGSSNTTLTYNSQDPSNILKDVLDKFNSTVSYTNDTVDLTGSTVSYTFRLNSYLEAIQIVKNLAPDDWYWYNDVATNEIYFKEKQATPIHTFILGQHIQSLDLTRSMEELVNDVYFVGGDTGGGSYLYKRYSDATSISTYRRGLERISDSRVTVVATAETLSNRLIDEKKNPVYNSTVTILADTYDIESIRLGDSVGFANFNNFVDSVVLQIVEIDYSPEKVVLGLELNLDNTNKRIEDLNRNQQDIAFETIPTQPS